MEHGATPGPEGPAPKRVDSAELNQQFVVAYGRGQGTRVYTTAYTFSDAREALVRCVGEHGRWGARIVPALSSHPPAL